ncbi:hypothetical protein BRADI_1g16051v3 [Brachypodium distachyon]|uniref:Reverse transcriptase zinc-binding domain-containing protein n=1 Tax=Brachypodium distachyon TaxID=15368 RepID=A0A2K2DJQ3_BRADI|nr:hypothetical protein BRADI_1g16051v3 [Brachypodium distachyon]
METISHLLFGCVVVRQVWTSLLSSWGHADWIPEADLRLRDWWTSLLLPRQTRKDFQTMIILVLLTIWRHRNDVVFNGASLPTARILQCIREEPVRWEHARLFKGRVSLVASEANGSVDTGFTGRVRCVWTFAFDRSTSTTTGVTPVLAKENGGEATLYLRGYHVHPHFGHRSPPGIRTAPASLHAPAAATSARTTTSDTTRVHVYQSS